MPERYFIDTNIIIYSILNNIDIEKNSASREFLSTQSSSCLISNRVINEFINVLRRYKVNNSIISNILKSMVSTFDAFTIIYSTSQLTLELRDELNYSFFDLMIIASAIQSEATVIITDDLHHEHKIKENLKNNKSI